MFDLLPNTQRQAVIQTDFTVVTSGANGFKTIAAGTAAAIAAGTATATQFGVNLITTGTETTGYAGYQNELTSVLIGGGKILLETEVMFPTVSDGTDTYSYRFGLNSAADGTAGTSFIGFEYGSALSSGVWRGVTKATTSTVVTGSAIVAATVYRLTCVIEPDGLKASFFVNGTFIGFSSSTLPATTVPLGVVTTILKSAGTTARTAHLDYIKVVKEFSTER